MSWALFKAFWFVPGFGLKSVPRFYPSKPWSPRHTLNQWLRSPPLLSKVKAHPIRRPSPPAVWESEYVSNLKEKWTTSRRYKLASTKIYVWTLTAAVFQVSKSQISRLRCQPTDIWTDSQCMFLWRRVGTDPQACRMGLFGFRSHARSASYPYQVRESHPWHSR